MADLTLAVIGLGNAGATFVQGVDYYSNDKHIAGLWHEKVAGLKAANIKIVAAYDINPAKVGRALSQVATETIRKYHAVKDTRINVNPGILYDNDYSRFDSASTVSFDQFTEDLRKSGAQVALNLISSGLDRTSIEYAKAALQARVSFVNATPTKVANDPKLASKFAQRKLVLAGDDLLSQFGGTAFHKGMIDFMIERGVHVKKSYQLDVGGSAETKKTMDARIRMLKRSMKTSSISIEVPYKFESVAGTTEYTDFLDDSRNSYYWMASEGFLGSNIVMDITLHTSDGPNAGNVLLDIARAIGGGKRTRTGIATEVISAYGFKNPPKKYKIRDAYTNFIKMFC